MPASMKYDPLSNQYRTIDKHGQYVEDSSTDPKASAVDDAFRALERDHLIWTLGMVLCGILPNSHSRFLTTEMIERLKKFIEES